MLGRGMRPGPPLSQLSRITTQFSQAKQVVRTRLTTNSAAKAGAFGAAAGVAALFFTSGIPRIQKDILQVMLPQPLIQVEYVQG